MRVSRDASVGAGAGAGSAAAGGAAGAPGTAGPAAGPPFGLPPAASTVSRTARAMVRRFTNGVYRLCCRAAPRRTNVPEKAQTKTDTCSGGTQSKAELHLDGKVMELPVVVGTEDEKGLDIGKL